MNPPSFYMYIKFVTKMGCKIPHNKVEDSKLNPIFILSVQTCKQSNWAFQRKSE